MLRWNQLDIAIVALSIMGITLEELKLSAALPINPTIIRIMRVLRIARGAHALTHYPVYLYFSSNNLTMRSYVFHKTVINTFSTFIWI